jgi:hypothetical protein
MPDEIIPINEFCERTKKKPRQVRRLYTIHDGLKHQVRGEKTSRVNYTLWLRIVANPNGYVKLRK